MEINYFLYLFNDIPICVTDREIAYEYAINLKN
jgi:hypothetical protein